MKRNGYLEVLSPAKIAELVHDSLQKAGGEMTKGYLCVRCGSQIVGHSAKDCDSGHVALIVERLHEEVFQLKQAIAAQPHVTFNGGYPPVYCSWDSNSNCRKLEDCTPMNCVWTMCQP